MAEVHRAIAERLPGERCFTFGHLGDGNLHFVVVGSAGPEARQTVEEIVYRPLEARQGSVSAEHGIGALTYSGLHHSPPAALMPNSP